MTKDEKERFQAVRFKAHEIEAKVAALNAELTKLVVALGAAAEVCLEDDAAPRPAPPPPSEASYRCLFCQKITHGPPAFLIVTCEWCGRFGATRTQGGPC